MRKWMLILLAISLLCGCSREQEPLGALDSEEPESRVEVELSVLCDEASTKALGESPRLETMHVAVFGGSGYLKEYSEAELVSIGTYEYTYTDIDEVTPITKTVPEYTYRFSLALSNSSRRVHFIGNGPESIPFGRDYEVLPALLGEKETGFWQMVTLPNVTALKDDEEDYVYPDLSRKREDGEPYVPSAELKEALSDIPLIRNWAKIELKAKPVEESHFIPYSFAVVNVPKYGTLVPYGGEKGFITNYKDLSFDILRGAEYNYAGNLPASVEFDHELPSHEDFVNFTGGAKAYNPSAPADSEQHTVYLYERPVPDVNIEPTYVLVYGKYLNPDDNSLSETDQTNGIMCYYKVDLMAGSEYYPVLRNFKYEIQIDEISVRGHDTPAQAAAAAGSADVSADINASGLSDISDGTRRMAVQPWMSKTFIRAEEKQAQLYVAYYDNINADHPTPNMRPECVSFELIPQNAGIVQDVEIGDAVDDTSADNYGWRPISFAIASPEEAAARSQTLRIICKTRPDDPEETPLYRDVVISLLPTQDMRVSCENERVLMVKGESQRLDVAIPDGLVESMFPLYFIIEATNLTLTPDNSKEGNNLPVISEKSIVDGRQTFHYQRTLDWAEYNGLSSKMDLEDETLWRTFYSYFKTNCEASATQVYVSNEFFHMGNTSFVNYASFRGPHFTTPVPCEAGRSVSATAQLMTESQALEPVYLDLHGLEPADDSGIFTDPETGEYCYTPTGVSMNFNFKTTTADGDVYFTLRSKALPYEDMVVAPWRFRDAKIQEFATPEGNTHTGGGFNNVAYGHVSSLASKPLLVSFFTEPESYKYLTGNQRLSFSVSSYSGVNAVNAWNDGGNISATAVDYYREKWFSTVAGGDPVSITLSCNGYLEETVSAPRHYGNIYSMTISSAGDWNKFVNNGGFFQYDQTQNQVRGRFTLEVTPDKDVVRHDGSSGIVLPAGGHYELEANIESTNNDVYLYYGQVFYYTENNTPYKPRAVVPEPDGSVYYGYLGNNYEYMWDLPRGATGGKLVIDAPADRDVVITRMVLRGFHGVLNTSGDAGGGDIGFGEGLKDGGRL